MLKPAEYLITKIVFVHAYVCETNANVKTIDLVLYVAMTLAMTLLPYRFKCVMKSRFVLVT